MDLMTGQQEVHLMTPGTLDGPVQGGITLTIGLIHIGPVFQQALHHGIVQGTSRHQIQHGMPLSIGRIQHPSSNMMTTTTTRCCCCCCRLLWARGKVLQQQCQQGGIVSLTRGKTKCRDMLVLVVGQHGLDTGIVQQDGTQMSPRPRVGMTTTRVQQRPGIIVVIIIIDDGMFFS
eukprot:scaffold5935_cov237-Amphora_coffeaeformis.AAC.2